MTESDAGLNDETLGVFHGDTRRIQVRSGLHPQQRQQVLHHEWIHALLWDSGLTNALTREVEEQLCDVIASGIVASSL